MAGLPARRHTPKPVLRLSPAVRFGIEDDDDATFLRPSRTIQPVPRQLGDPTGIAATPCRAACLAAKSTQATDKTLGSRNISQSPRRQCIQQVLDWSGLKTLRGTRHNGEDDVITGQSHGYCPIEEMCFSRCMCCSSTEDCVYLRLNPTWSLSMVRSPGPGSDREIL